MSILLKYESGIRFGFFFGMLILMNRWEVAMPCRRPFAPRLMRWLSNLGLLVLGTTILRTVFPLAAVGTAAMAAEGQWGLFNVISLAPWQSVVLAIIILDFTTYVQHVLFHAWPLLWRVHKVHHADLEVDVTTGLRFHPLELCLSMVSKTLIIALLGAPVMAVLIFEVLLNATSMFNHSNVQLPKSVDRVLRRFVVTPDMHRIHHSAMVQETNSNFGFNIPWWDHLFGTYRDQPSVSPQAMTLGLAEYQHDRRVEQLPWMLVLPFDKR